MKSAKFSLVLTKSTQPGATGSRIMKKWDSRQGVLFKRHVFKAGADVGLFRLVPCFRFAVVISVSGQFGGYLSTLRTTLVALFDEANAGVKV